MENIGLQSSLLAIAVVDAVADDDVVEEVETHGVAGLMDTVGQAVVVAAGMRIVRRVVVAKGQHGGIREHRFLHHHANIDGGIGDFFTTTLSKIQNILVSLQHKI